MESRLTMSRADVPATSDAMRAPAEGMSLIPGGAFLMGSERFYPEERPRRRVKVDPFWIDTHLVTNRDFGRFVDATGYRTVAEIPPDPRLYGLDPNDAYAGSLVFQRTSRPVPLYDHTSWWAFVRGADWRHPAGEASDIATILDHPVVHVAYADAEAYARWAGKSLPTEAEWEFAARGGLEDADYAWGDELEPGGMILANYWRGLFPFASLRDGGKHGTTEVGTYPPNGYGLYDMIANVWEWTRDWYAMPASAKRTKNCCTISNPRGGTLTGSVETGGPRIGRKVLKGGSHLCASSYCQRYRPAARHAQSIDSSASHIGFRCVARESTRSR
jgi:formylglycine-generating enzyme required for sulfatase activity